MLEEAIRHTQVDDSCMSLTLTDQLTPARASGSAGLARKIARRTASRLRRAGATVSTPAGRPHVPGAPRLLRDLARILHGAPVAMRAAWLGGPDLRGFLADYELWTGVFRDASRMVVEPADRRAGARLFAAVCRTEHLVDLLPHGRLDRHAPERVRRFARLQLQRSFADLAAALAGFGLACADRPRLDLRLEFRQEPELGRPGDRIDLGTFAGPAGALAIVAGRRGAATDGQSLRTRLTGGTLRMRFGRSEVLVPAAGSPLRFAHRPHAVGEDRIAAAPVPPLRLLARPLIPGTSIILSPVLHSGRRQIRVGRHAAGLRQRLGGALRVVHLAWPEAYEEIIRRTAMVVPVRETNLVSYSLASRPGISYINVFGKRIVDLADDLLHETAHHLLHDLQETVRLLEPGSGSDDVQAFHSPWRGTLRPLHGLLHGTYTFLYRAELLLRLRDAPLPARRVLARIIGPDGARLARREFRRELSMLAPALGDLGVAARAGLLTGPGRELVRAMRLWYSRLAVSGRSSRQPARRGRRG